MADQVQNPGIQTEEAERFYTFTASDELQAIVINTRGFPKNRLEALRGLTFPVERVEYLEDRPTWVRIRVGEIALTLANNDQKQEANWWSGLALGMTVSSTLDQHTGPMVAFSVMEGELEEVS